MTGRGNDERRGKILKSTLSFHFNSLESPTQFNLAQEMIASGFHKTDYKNANFTDDNIGANDIALQNLEYKHKLTDMLKKHKLPLSPISYTINETNFSTVISQIEKNHQHDNFIWIYKPSTLNNGQDIKLFKNINEIKKHYQTTNRLGGDFVLQQYIENPHLLNGHKYTLRMFVILTNYNGYTLYPQGYYNIGLKKYPTSNDFSDLSAHLTNEHLCDPEPNVIQMPSSKVKEFDLLLPKISDTVSKTMDVFKKTAPEYFSQKKQKCFDILGFDFLLDNNFNLWLLEINHGPNFPKEEPHVLKQHLYNPFWKFLVEDFVIPISKKT